MSDPHHRDMMPMHEAQHSFDVVLRGYDKHQVAETIERLEADLRIAIADRDAAGSRSADLARQLSALHGEIESLRRKAATAAAPTFENMSERISHMLRLADEEATDIRAAAERDAQAVREQTAVEERALAERHAAGQAEVERMLGEARQNAEQIATKAQLRADELVQKAQERVARLDAESQARRAKAEEDFEIALRTRRAEAAGQEEERERVSTQAARQRVAEAQQQASTIVADAEAKAAAIRDVRDELTSRLLQARQLLSSLPDLGDRPQAAGEQRPTAEERPQPTGPQTNQLTVRTAEGESAAARQPVRQESPSPTPRTPTTPQPAAQAPAGQTPAPAPAQGPPTAVQPAVSADQPTGPAERSAGGARPGPPHPAARPRRALGGRVPPGPAAPDAVAHRHREQLRRGRSGAGSDHPGHPDAPLAGTPLRQGPVRGPRSRSLLLLLLLTAGAFAFLLPAGPAAAAECGLLRVAHLSPDSPAVDVMLAEAGSADPPRVVPGLAYGDVSPYSELPPGSYAVSVRGAGEDPATPPRLTATVDLGPGAVRTVAATGAFADLSLAALDDDLAAPAPGSARVRVLAAAAGAPRADVDVVGGPRLASDLASGQAAGYIDVPAGTAQLRLAPGEGRATTATVALDAGSVYSLLLLDDDGGGLTTRLVRDAAGPAAVPAGAVDAGVAPARPA